MIEQERQTYAFSIEDQRRLDFLRWLIANGRCLERVELERLQSEIFWQGLRARA